MQCIQCHVRVTPWPEAIGEPAKVGVSDGTEHFTDRAPGRSYPRERALQVSVFRHRLLECKHVAPAVAGSDPCGPFAEIAEILLQPLLILCHTHSIDACACLPLLPSECTVKRIQIDVMQQCGEPSLGNLSGCRVTRSRFGIRTTRLCVRTLTSSCEVLSGRSLCSPRFVSFNGFIGTMDQSESRPQLGPQLRQCLVADPHQRPVWQARSGPSCSDNCLP